MHEALFFSLTYKSIGLSDAASVGGLFYSFTRLGQE